MCLFNYLDIRQQSFFVPYLQGVLIGQRAESSSLGAAFGLTSEEAVCNEKRSLQLSSVQGVSVRCEVSSVLL